MSIKHLDALFKPRSVAVIGAGNKPHSIGAVVMRNLLQAGFGGPVMPVNANDWAVSGVLAYSSISHLPVTPDLAVLCSPPAAIAPIIDQLGRLGTHAAVVLTSGLNEVEITEGVTARQAMLEAARRYELRILGSNCLGLLVPGIGLNASYAPTHALPGKLAFISQSAALCTTVLDWARSRGIGFSHFISIGNAEEIRFSDVIDYLGSDPNTHAILLYIESIRQSRDFMSAARAAARNKPVLAIKAGRMPEGARAAASHTRALAGSDAVYDTAFGRAGMLRVFDIDELFDAVETLGRGRLRTGQRQGDRLAIVCNGGGPGILAVDSLVVGEGRLAQFSEETLRALERLLPSTWSRCNPVDILADATPDRYTQTLKTLLKDPGVDAILVMHVPTALADSQAIAQAVREFHRGMDRTLLTSWLGGNTAERTLFAEAGIPTYETPDKAVRAFLHRIRYQRNQEMLMETPPSVPAEFTPNTVAARRAIEHALARGGGLLSECEAKDVLAAYGIPVVTSHLVANAEEAIAVAHQIGFPVVLKIVSPEITHKSDVGGVALDLRTPKAMRVAARTMAERLAELNPSAQIEGFCVQKMEHRPRAYELIVGVAVDATFGPVILFGQGGTAVEVVSDRAVALPPLNMHLAKELVSRTRIYKLLQGYRDHPPADLDAICLTLLQVDQIIIDVPEIVELEVNPLIADEGGVVVLDARVAVAPWPGGVKRLAIQPYPKQLEETVVLPSGRTVQLRPIRPEDEPAYHALLTRLTPEDIRFRYFGSVRDFSHSQLARQTQVDYDREMAFIAITRDAEGHPEMLAEVRIVTDLDNTRAEFAITVRSDIKGQGLGRLLLDKMIRYCKSLGVRELIGQVLPDNNAMRRLAKSLGFETHMLPEGDAVEVVLTFRED